MAPFLEARTLSVHLISLHLMPPLHSLHLVCYEQKEHKPGRTRCVSDSVTASVASELRVLSISWACDLHVARGGDEGEKKPRPSGTEEASMKGHFHFLLVF